MSKFHKLKIAGITKETTDCVSVTFDLPTELKNDFQYVPGQYLALETEIKGEKVRRSYSLCSAPHEDVWQVAIKKVDGGKFSTYANEQMKEGETIDVMPPTGNFQLKTDKKAKKNYVAFAAGSGITPVLSMIKSVMNTETQSTFTLFYGNKNFDSIIFREEIESLKNVYMDRLSVNHVLSKERLGSDLFYGRIDGEKCEKFAKAFYNPKEVDGYYLCGPSQMIFAVKEKMEEMGVVTSKIHFELFNTDDLPQKQKEEKAKYFDPNVESMVTIVLDGDRMNMPLSYGGTNILDAALAAGADLPYACKGGVCSTCKARIMEGEVDMDINYALEPDEVEKGFVLTCQSHPRSSKVVVDFDEA